MIEIGNNPYENHPSYYKCHNSMLQNSRDLLLKGLAKIPQISVFPPKGGYFFVISVENLIKFVPKRHFYKEESPENGSEPVGENFNDLKNPDFTPGTACFLWLAKEIGVNMIPLDQFYENDEISVGDKKGRFLLRVSVTAKPSSIEGALERLMKIVNIVEHKN